VIRWADGQSATINVLEEYVAVQADFNRFRSAFPDEFISNTKYLTFGIPGEEISITRIDDRQRPRFMAAAMSSNVGVLGVPIRSTSGPDAPIVGVVTDEIIVRFADGLDDDAIQKINEEMGVRVVDRGDGQFRNRFTLAPTGPTGDKSIQAHAVELAERYFEMDETEYAHPNLIIKKVARSNDPLLSSQWHLRNTGQGGGVVGADSRAVDAWSITQGENIVIAIIDPDGVQHNHEDLIANRFVNPGEAEQRDDGRDNDNNGLVDDWSGWNFALNVNNPTTSGPHGTAAAGVAAAACENALGGCGVAPRAKILGIALGSDVQDDADAFRYAAQVGADVISNSWGYALGTLQRPTDVVEEAINFAATEGRNGKGAVIVFAMTNENVDNFSGTHPDISSLPRVVAVGRSTNFDRWGRSGFGDGMALLGPTQAANGSPTSGCDGNDLAGTLDIVTTDLRDDFGYNRGQPESCFCNPSVPEMHATPNYTACFGGTSSATPLVAGVAALVLSVNPDLTRQEVVDILIGSADKIDEGAANYSPDGNGRWYSQTHGFGRVNAARAVELAQQTLVP
jgi:subtilisin family serine protease